MASETILLVPEKLDEERERVVNAWQQKGRKVLKLGRFWQKPAELENQPVAIYGNDTFAQVVAQVLNIRLLSPDDSLLARLDGRYTKRNVRCQRLSEVTDADFPVFVKSVVPKQFKAGVYTSREELSQAVQGISPSQDILLSEIVTIQAEARAFILRGEVKDFALYEGSSDIQTGISFLQDFLSHQPAELPITYVVDLGFNAQQGWFIIEFNASWGAGLNGCDPQKVIDCIIAGTQL
jgi:hypothetical protein